MLRALIAGLAALTLAGLAQPAAAACQFVKLTELPVTMVGLRPTIKVKLNGQDVTMLVDTGAFFSGVSEETAQRLKLKPVPAPFGMSIRGVGGQEREARAVLVNDFNFAGVPLKNYDFLLGGRIGGGGIDGIIGENLLGGMEVEYDLANGVLRIFRAKDCGFDVNLAYWSGGQSLSKVRLSSKEGERYMPQLIATAQVDGRNIRVVLDSGSPLSVLSRPAAARAGIKSSSEGVRSAGVTYGAYGGGMQTFIAPFESFGIGDELIKNTQLRVADIDLGEGDMLLGTDFFLSHRILVSNSQHRLYFTYNGGPVFKLDRAPGSQTAQSSAGEATPPGPAGPVPAGTPAAGASAAGNPAAGDLKTAGEYARRGASEAARRDFAAAIADDTRAIDLDPKDPATFVARARARLESRQGVAALGDLNEALKLNADYAPALLLRGEATLVADKTRALADLEAAVRLSPNDRTLPLVVASAYLRAEEYERAIALMDAWLAEHPKDEDRARVLGQRCNARAFWGQDNEKGLADCDAALKADRSLIVYANRGLVLLRLGRLDEAIGQFDAAIKLEPKAPWALYGRGLAKTRKGDKAGGDADIAAALAVRPNLPQQAKRIGLAADTAAAPAKS